MKKIGIVGSDNSHALAFAKTVNFPNKETGEYLFENYRVTHIYGIEEEVTKEKFEAGKFETIVDKPEDMIGEVDGVVVVFRHGGLHKKYTLPFLKAGIPVFLDKPFTTSMEDIYEIIETAKENDTPLTGGSTLKYLDTVTEMKELVESVSLEKIGWENLFTGDVTYRIDLHNEYGGIHFYGPHTVETALRVFGNDVKSVYASRTDKNVTAIVKYDTVQITLNFIYGVMKKPAVTVITRDKYVTKQVTESNHYEKGAQAMVNMIESGESDLDYKHMIMSVAVLNMIEMSLKSGTEVDIDEVL